MYKKSIALISILFLASSAWANWAITTNLTCHWKFDLISNPTYATVGPNGANIGDWTIGTGQVGSGAAYINAKGGMAIWIMSGVIPTIMSSTVTYTYWMYGDSAYSFMGNWSVGFQADSGNLPQTGMFFNPTGNGNKGIVYWLNGSPDASNQLIWYPATGVFADKFSNKWCHVAVTYDRFANNGAGEMNLYINGQYIMSKANNTYIASPPLYYSVARRPWSPVNDNMHGRIDDFRMYTIALTGDQIRLLPGVPQVTRTRYVYVDVDAVGANNGSSWTNAYRRLSDALTDAGRNGNVIEIRVAQGVYRPDESTASPLGTGDRNASFRLAAGVAVKGGYAGYGEANPDARNFSTYQTILSGDLGNDDDGFTNNAENSYHVVTGTDGASLEGFTITGGNANGPSSPTNKGGGMYNVTADPTVVNCVFTYNNGNAGGAMYNETTGNPVVTGCLFASNRGLNGAGMYNCGGTTSVTNCTFSGNQASYDVGGIYSYQTCPVVNSCIFWGNTDDSYGSEEPAQISLISYSGAKYINYCCIENLTGELGGTGNTGSDPLFVDAANGDYHLQQSSDCVNTGNPAITYDPAKKDLDYEYRVIDGRVDIGSDETLDRREADFNNDGIVDYEDMSTFAGSWLSEPGQGNWNELCDLYEDDQMDIADYAVFAGSWMWQASWYVP